MQGLVPNPAGAIGDLPTRDARQLLLLGISDRVRNIGDPVEIQGVACELLGRFLHVQRVVYADVEADEYVIRHGWHRDAPPISLRGRVADYGSALVDAYQRGEPVAVRDVLQDTRFNDDERTRFREANVRAFISVMLVKDGRWVGSFACDAPSPRTWVTDDLLLLRDVAERIWEAVERARAVAALREADARKAEFLAVLGHELRNPLAAIKGGLKLVQSTRITPERRLSTLDVIAEQVNHVERLINDLLDLSRIERGKLHICLERVRLQDVVQRAADMARDGAAKREIRLEVSLPPEPFLANADPVRLAQILVNLLTNAIKFSSHGGAVNVTLQRSADLAAIRVRDFGCGIAPELLPRIFDTYVQSRHALHVPEAGLGLGLSIARNLARAHGGTLEAFSAGEGQGTELVLQIPLLPPA